MENCPMSKSPVFMPPTWGAIRRAVLERDGYQCRICGRDGAEVQLHVHHVDRDRRHNSGRNLVTLCRGCHAQVHSEGYEPIDRQPIWGRLTEVHIPIPLPKPIKPPPLPKLPKPQKPVKPSPPTKPTKLPPPPKPPKPLPLPKPPKPPLMSHQEIVDFLRESAEKRAEAARLPQ